MQTPTKGSLPQFAGIKGRAFRSLREAVHHTATQNGPMKNIASDLDWSPSELCLRTTLGTDNAVARLIEIEKMREDGTVEKLPKKEVIMLEREHRKLIRGLGGIRLMTALPSAVFIVDTKKEQTTWPALSLMRSAACDTRISAAPLSFTASGRCTSARSVHRESGARSRRSRVYWLPAMAASDVCRHRCGAMMPPLPETDGRSRRRRAG